MDSAKLDYTVLLAGASTLGLAVAVADTSAVGLLELFVYVVKYPAVQLVSHGL